MNNVVIVESPAKAKTINKYLGKDFTVISSYGHVRDIPSKSKAVDPDNDFSIDYQVNDKSAKHVANIIKAVKGAENIYLASDPDREGEAIAWHIVEVLKAKKALKKDTNIRRIAFHEITKKAVQEAIKSPRDINIDLVNAQQARRVLDYLVGFTLSPILWRKLPGSKSAGRVQSVALRLICEREDEIEKFITQEYWTIKCQLAETKTNQSFLSRLIVLEGRKLEKFDLPTEADTHKVVDVLQDCSYSVKSIEKKQQARRPYPPFITSTLQQEASHKLGFGAKKTMQIAQKLYEGIEINGETVALITYMRTDSIQLSQDSIAATRDHIKKSFGDNYLPASPNVYKSKIKNAQEAHEAIRPIDVNITPDSIKAKLDKDNWALYDLIWKRTVACQMTQLILDQVHVTISAIEKNKKDDYALFKTVGTTVAFDGFTKVYRQEEEKESDDEDNAKLPKLNESELLDLKKLLPEQHFTEPPPRYSEASLVKKLEELGIGRPSTYANILSVLQERSYVILQQKRFHPEERGRLVTAFLIAFFKQYVEYDFTANLEDRLDLVSNGQLQWKEFLKDFWESFHNTSVDVQKHNIEQIIAQMEPLIEHHIFGDKAGSRDCPACKEGKLSVKLSKYGPFVGCSRYPECKYTKRVGDEASSEEGADGAPSLDLGNKTVIGVSESGQNVYLKKGPYGFYLQMGEDKAKDMKRSPIPKGVAMDSLDMPMATKILSLPRAVGTHPDSNQVIKAGVGRFGPYLFCDGKYTSLQTSDQVFNITVSEALEIINAKGAKQGRVIGSYNGHDIVANSGRFGPYLKYDGKNIKLPKSVDMASLELEEAKTLVDGYTPSTAKEKASKPRSPKKNKA